MAGWLALLTFISVLAGVAIWRQPRVGALGSFVALYVFYQISSLSFLIPRALYKDGGNGTLADWHVWVIISVIWTGTLLVAAYAFRRLLPRR